MRVLAIGVGAVAFGKMQTVRDSLGSELMREIAVVAGDASTFFQKVFANRDSVRVVLVSARWAFGARSCDKN